MKLSWKFFCISYIIVLLSTSIGGFLLVNNSVSRSWEEREQILELSETYAVDSFLSLSNLITGEIHQLRCDAMAKQIKGSLDSAVKNVSIRLCDDTSTTHSMKGSKSFFTTENSCTMKIDCPIDVNGRNYVVEVESDFTDILLYEREIWGIYRITVLLISAISGSILFILADRITKPLKRLTAATKSIADGNYGETVIATVKGGEISTLTDNFNTMSLAVKNSMDAVKTEVKKRENFIADFSHEMKTPMTAIIGYADMLRSYELDDIERKDAANAVFKEGKRLEKLSHQLLELLISRNDSCELSVVNLLDLKSALMETLKFNCEKYEVELKINFENIEVEADRTLILSLLYNLADNAFKASEKNSVVEIRSERLEDGVRFTVTDHGKGISQDKIPWLTEPFWREDKSRSRKDGGTGLGLAICEEIARLHHSKLEITSQLQEGTAVSFMLKTGGNEK